MGIEMTDLEDAKGIAGVAGKPQFRGEKTITTLKEASTLIMGQSPSSDSYNADSNGLPFYQGNADFGEDNPTPRIWCTDPKKIAEKGDILISVRAPIGAINIADEQCCIGRGIAAIRPNTELVSRDYLRHQLCASRDKLEAMGTGSTFKAIGKKALGGFAITIYPKKGQETIAYQFNWVAEHIKLANSQLAQLDNLVKSRFIEMFGDALNSDNRWPERTLGSMLDIARGGSPRPIKSYLTSDPAGINWIKIGDAVNGSRYIENTAERIKPSGAKKSRLVHSGDFLLSNSMSFGRPYILKTEGCIHDGWLVLQGVDGCFDSLFLYQLLASDDMLHRFRGLVRGGVVNNLNKDLVSSVSVMVPPIGLQRDFATFVQQVDKLRFMLLGNPSPTYRSRSFCCSTNSDNGGVILEAKDY